MIFTREEGPHNSVFLLNQFHGSRVVLVGEGTALSHQRGMECMVDGMQAEMLLLARGECVRDALQTTNRTPTWVAKYAGSLSLRVGMSEDETWLRYSFVVTCGQTPAECLGECGG